jgi:hypothetical protein
MGSAQNSGISISNLSKESNRFQGKLTGDVYYLSPVSNANYFLQKDWQEGSITLKDGDIFENIRMRYMAYGDELVAYNVNNRTLFVVDKSIVKEFNFYSRNETEKLTKQKFINIDSLKILFNKSYFHELYSGTSKLLCFYQVEQVKVSPYIGVGGRMFDFEFRLKTMYYILSKEKGISKIQIKNRSLYSLYPEHKKEIKKLFRKNRINIIDESSAIQAVETLDSAGFFK